jgi:hypothetical protein
MSLPNAVILRQLKIEIENAQSNTMLCKQSMNFTAGGKKLVGKIRSWDPRAY